jgi:hypothetical protein
VSGQRSLLGRIWEGIGHVHLATWLIEILRPTLAPAVAVATGYLGINEGAPGSKILVMVAVAFGAVMLGVNQVAAWVNRYRSGYSYGLAYEGISFGYSPDTPDKVLQLGVRLRNVTHRPMKYSVRRFDVIVGTVTLPKPKFETPGGLIQSSTGRTYHYPSFSKEQLEHVGLPHAAAIVKCEISYGHPDHDLSRCLIMETQLSLSAREGGKHASTDIILSEQDLEI